MSETKHTGDQTTGGIKLFGATISIQELLSKDESIKVEETTEKRPDKIISCPRCKSMETKFCYFNNYNVNQPRHFCKGCQRYWTAGGALRNVPVGAGRRKSKPRYRGFAEFSDGYLFHGSGFMPQYEFEHDGAVEEWRHVAEHDDIHHIFPAKRRRNASDSQLF